MSNETPPSTPSHSEARSEGSTETDRDASASPFVTATASRASITESRPTNPLFIADSQPPPEEYGQDRYTSRQPWMSHEETVIDRHGSTSGLIVDGASLSPFEGQSPPLPRKPVMEEAAVPGVMVADESEDTPEAPAPIVRRRSVGSGVLISLFALFAKGIPLMLVMGGGYYTYSYFFGPIPIVDKVWRKTAPLVGIAPAPVETQSKVSQILQQTRDVVKANDQRVHFASALADQEIDLNALSHPAAMEVVPKSSENAVAQSPQNLVGKEKSKLTNEWKSQLSKRAPGPSTGPVNYTLRMQNTGVVEVATEVEPSQEFFAWVNQATISGVRIGEDTRVFINGMAMDPGEIIYHPLGIVIDRLDSNGTVLVFRDRTGATLGKRF